MHHTIIAMSKTNHSDLQDKDAPNYTFPLEPCPYLCRYNVCYYETSTCKYSHKSKRCPTPATCRGLVLYADPNTADINQLPCPEHSVREFYLNRVELVRELQTTKVMTYKRCHSMTATHNSISSSKKRKSDLNDSSAPSVPINAPRSSAQRTDGACHQSSSANIHTNKHLRNSLTNIMSYSLRSQDRRSSSSSKLQVSIETIHLACAASVDTSHAEQNKFKQSDSCSSTLMKTFLAEKQTELKNKLHLTEHELTLNAKHLNILDEKLKCAIKSKSTVQTELQAAKEIYNELVDKFKHAEIQEQDIITQIKNHVARCDMLSASLSRKKQAFEEIQNTLIKNMDAIAHLFNSD